jgi:Flp pilus assembly pilin Flp
MKKLLLKNAVGQDLIEYALMAGFLAVTLGAFIPGLTSTISTIFSELGAAPSVASIQGS